MTQRHTTRRKRRAMLATFDRCLAWLGAVEEWGRGLRWPMPPGVNRVYPAVGVGEGERANG